MIRAVFAFLLLIAALPARAAVDIQEVTSPGGLTAWLVEEHEIPFVAVEIRFKGGASLEEPGKRGAINLMTGLIEEGAGDLSAQDFAAAREALAARFEFDVGRDSLNVSARFLSENRDDAVELLRLALIEPRFDESALDRVRGQVIAGLRADATDPDEIAAEAFNTYAFGGHPYGTKKQGSVDSVTALTRDDIVTAHRNVLSKENLYVGVVGDITADELGALLDRLLGDLPETGAPAPEMASISFSGGTSIVPFDTPQSVAIFGHEGIERDDPDFFAAFVMNEIMGGGRSGRLMEEVREKRGLTYGIYAYLMDADYADLYLGQVRSSNGAIAEAIEVIRAEWERLATEGVTEDELNTAKTYLTGAYPLRFDGNARIARILAGMQLGDLPIDYIATRNDKVNAVTLEDVKRVAARLVRPENLHFVVVGQPEGLEATN